MCLHSPGTEDGNFRDHFFWRWLQNIIRDRVLCGQNTCAPWDQETEILSTEFETLLAKYKYLLLECTTILAWNHPALESCTFSSLFPPYILPRGIISRPVRHSFHSQFLACFWRQSPTNSPVVHWIITKGVIFYCKFLIKWVKAKEIKIMYLTPSSTTQRNARLKFLIESYLTTGFYGVDPFISTQLIEGILH